jgi:ethylbenzene hydroxylase subunit beta/complex iron-sulfur molybdoenzyme family reductase subunit beta
MAPPKLDDQGYPTDEPRIPVEYLESLFGPDVRRVLGVLKDERERSARGEPSEVMDLLISRKWIEMFGPFKRHPREIEQIQGKTGGPI